MAAEAAILAIESFSSPWLCEDMLPDLSMRMMTANEGIFTAVFTSMVTGSRRSTGVP